jgi:hypothetical protein
MGAVDAAADCVPTPTTGDVVAIAEVGGLHHRYERHAA